MENFPLIFNRIDSNPQGTFQIPILADLHNPTVLFNQKVIFPANQPVKVDIADLFRDNLRLAREPLYVPRFRFSAKDKGKTAIRAKGEFKVRVKAVAHEKNFLGPKLFQKRSEHFGVRLSENPGRFPSRRGLEHRHEASDIRNGAQSVRADEIRMGHPKIRSAFEPPTNLAEFGIIERRMVGDKDELRRFERRMNIEGRILGGKPFRDFGVREQVNAPDSAAVNFRQGERHRRKNGIPGLDRKPHAQKTVRVKDKRLARIVRKIVHGNLFRDAAHGLDGPRIGLSGKVEGSIQIEYDSLDLHTSQFSIYFWGMKSPDTRFYVPDLFPGSISLSDEESSHAIRVCRVRPEDILRLTDGKGHFAEGTVEAVAHGICTVRVETVETSKRPRPRLHLGIACLKDDGNEEVALHVSEMEVGSITLFRTDRSEEPKDSPLSKIVRRSELKAKVSLKQSLKAWLTEIRGPIALDSWLENYKGDIVLCDENGEDSIGKIENETTLLVGPEGGFSPREIELVKSYGNGSVRLLKLGATRLRARTAAIVGIGKCV